MNLTSNCQLTICQELLNWIDFSESLLRLVYKIITITLNSQLIVVKSNSIWFDSQLQRYQFSTLLKFNERERVFAPKQRSSNTIFWHKPRTQSRERKHSLKNRNTKHLSTCCNWQDILNFKCSRLFWFFVKIAHQAIFWKLLFSFNLLDFVTEKVDFEMQYISPTSPQKFILVFSSSICQI